MSKALLVIWIVTCILIHANAVVPWLYSAQFSDKSAKGAHLDFWRTFGETDARYLKSDNLIIALEGMMVFADLPLSVIWLFAVIFGSRKQYLLQLMVSCFQLFGTSMYFLGAFLRDFADINTDPAQFWGGFAVGNGIWWIVPLLLIAQAGHIIAASLSHPTAVRSAKKTQ